MATRKAKATKASASKATARKSTRTTPPRRAARARAGSAADASSSARRARTAAGAAGAGTGKAAGGAGRGSRAGAGGAASGAGRPYERLFLKLRDDFAALGKEVVRDVDDAIDRARRDLKGRIVDDERLRGLERELRERVAAVRERVGEASAEARARARQASERLQSDERVRAATESGLHALGALASALRGAAEHVERSVEERRSLEAGQTADAGRYACRTCGRVVELFARETLPACASCGGRGFTRAR